MATRLQQLYQIIVGISQPPYTSVDFIAQPDPDDILPIQFFNFVLHFQSLIIQISDCVHVTVRVHSKYLRYEIPLFNTTGLTKIELDQLREITDIQLSESSNEKFSHTQKFILHYSPVIEDKFVYLLFIIQERTDLVQVNTIFFNEARLVLSHIPHNDAKLFIEKFKTR